MSSYDVNKLTECIENAKNSDFQKQNNCTGLIKTYCQQEGFWACAAMKVTMETAKNAEITTGNAKIIIK